MEQSIQEWTTAFSPLDWPLCPHKKKKLWKTAFKKRLSTKNITWFILEYFVPYIGRIAKRLSVVLTKNKFSTKFSSFE